MLPEPLTPLMELAHNFLVESGQPDAVELFPAG